MKNSNVKVKIKMKTSQHFDNGEIQTIESFYNGEKIEKNGSIYISFNEYETIKDSRSTIKISDDEVLILKSGEVRAKMKFKENTDYSSVYSTIYGDFNMFLHTYKISKRILDNEIKLNLDYKITIKNFMNANNRIEIKVVPEDVNIA